MYDQMVRPPHTFVDVVHQHFALKRRTILQQLDEWDCKYNRTSHCVKEIKKLLSSKFSAPLPTPDKIPAFVPSNQPLAIELDNDGFEDHIHDDDSEFAIATGVKRCHDVRSSDNDGFEDYSHLLYNEDVVATTVASAAKKPKAQRFESSNAEIIDLT